MKTVLLDLSRDELNDFVVKNNWPKFRAGQIAEWLGRGAPDFSVMKNLPENMREDLNKIATTLPLKIVQKLDSSDGQPTKFLLEMADGEVIESVLMRTTYGNSVCVSSQAGCAMGCKFCASTLLGLKRNLTLNEIYAQVLVATWELRGDSSVKANGDKNNNDVSHIVIMGTGEPLQNTENVIGFMERAHDELGIGWRKITVSTCGIVPGIERLIEWGHPVNLAISLHAPTDSLRTEIMPANNKYKIDDVLKACDDFTAKNNRQLMIEYILLSKMENGEKVPYNCDLKNAEQLAEILRGKNCMVNLIPWNSVDEREFASPSGNTIHRFQDYLIDAGIHTRIRRERGTDIGSACGQLRLNNKK